MAVNKKAQANFNNYMHNVPDDHVVLFKKDEFKKNCKDMRECFISFLSGSYALHLDGDGQTDEEWKAYNGVPDYFMRSLEHKAIREILIKIV